MTVAVARPKGESERSGSPFAWRGGRALPCGTSGPQLRLPAEITYISGQHLPYGRKCVRKCTLFSAAGGFEVGCVSQRDVTPLTHSSAGREIVRAWALSCGKVTACISTTYRPLCSHATFPSRGSASLPTPPIPIDICSAHDALARVCARTRRFVCAPPCRVRSR